MRIKLIIVVLISIFAIEISQAQKQKPDKEFSAFWKEFLKVVKSKDTEKLKNYCEPELILIESQCGDENKKQFSIKEFFSLYQSLSKKFNKTKPEIGVLLKSSEMNESLKKYKDNELIELYIDVSNEPGALRSVGLTFVKTKESFKMVMITYDFDC
ncbi:MAG: hypothetical protein HW421_1495 [Ignavibacteria bacterium]|nr:hypothetical protein [Ignavibacteria bacterium]